MAIQVKKKYTGQNKTDTLNGKIRIEDGNNRLVIEDNAVEVINITKDGLSLNDGTNNRLLLGRWPDGTIGLIISKTGQDVYNVFI